MAMVRCPTHGRVYDSTREAGCPLCLEERAMPRAPGGRAKQPPPEPRSSFLVWVLLVLVLGGGGYGAYRFLVARHRPSAAQQAYAQRRAEAARALGGTRVDTTSFVNPDDLTPIRRARQLSGALAALLRERARLLAFKEGPLDPASTSRAERQRVRDYARFASRWQARLDAATRNGTEFLYPPGTRFGPQMQSVSDQLNAALSVLRTAVPPDRVRSRAQRQSDLVEARGFLNAAGTVLSNLPK